MRFESITAHAFGPLRGAELAPARGMTVVYGPNEAGKSSWHAAIYAALCGVRRGRGGVRKEDREFAERHRPWVGDDWDVSARFELADGCLMEIRQDLAEKVDCRAMDLGAARDVSNEIMNDGAPDGSTLLGLDREAFLATACVRQADLLSVLDDADALQEHLQKAAATAGRDQTAAAAIDALVDFQKEQVGADRANARKPLRRGKERLERSRNELERIRQLHKEYLRLIEDAAAKTEERARLEARRQALAAIVAEDEAGELAPRLDRVRALAGKFRDGPPPSPTAGVELAHRVSSVLEAWENRRTIPTLEGPTATDLERELQALPDVPEGDREPNEQVTEAASGFEIAEKICSDHDRNRPPEPSRPGAGDASAEELRDLARELDQPEPAVDADLEERVAAARSEVERTRPIDRTRAAMLGGTVSLVLAGAVFAVGYPMAGFAVGVLGLVATLATLVAGDRGAHERALRDLREAEARHVVQDQLRKAVFERRESARKRAQALGVSADARELRHLVHRLEAADNAADALERWETRRAKLARDLEEAKERLRSTLRERGADSGPVLVEAVAKYRRDCTERARLAAAAARASDIRARLETRQTMEADAADTRVSEERMLAALRSAATACAVAGDSPVEIVSGLRSWQERDSTERRVREALAYEYRELETLLDGQDSSAVIADMEERLSKLRALATSRREPPLEGELHGRAAVEALASVEQEARKIDDVVNGLNGAIEDRARRLPSVADAEEELAEAEREIERVQRLDVTLKSTLGFLRAAEDRVHRDIASVLADTVRPWLPKITGGRYSDISVSAADLSVKVKDPDGHWRPAMTLSHGTAEQVYLLLRVALAEHLGKKDEPCPLLLDDVTVQADRGRTGQILDLLHALSADRQIILFTQEEEVRDWAREHLGTEEDRFIELPSAAAA